MNGGKSFTSQSSIFSNTSSSIAINIIQNHDFSSGLHSWHPNCCDGFVVSSDSAIPNQKPSKVGHHYALITNRKECWQGLEQDITSRVSAGSTYAVSARVSISGACVQDFDDVRATLRIEYSNSAADYMPIASSSICKEAWEILEGKFSLPAMPRRVVFYLEGPAPGVDLLIESVVISCASSDIQSKTTGLFSAGDENVILNPIFEDGLYNWSARGCKIALHDSMDDGKILPFSGKHFASATQRSQSWNGIQQDISGRAQRKLAYDVVATARIFGNNGTAADLQLTLWVQAPDLREQYIVIASLQATDKDWVQLSGRFLVNGFPSKVAIFLEGPPPGTDILLDNLVVKHAEKIPPSPVPVIEGPNFGVNILTNSNFSDGTNGWFPLGSCTLSVGTGSPRVLAPIARDSLGTQEPLSGHFILVTNRTENWMGPAQTITNKLKLFLTYQVSGWVRLASLAPGPQYINVSLGVDKQWVNGGQVLIKEDRWHEIGGSFRLEKRPSEVMVYIQGPAPGVDFMVSGLQIFAVDRQARFEHLKKQTDKIRKREIILKFSGSDWSTMHGASVKVKQTQNSFPIGSMVYRTNIDNESFANFFAKHFNWAVFGNEIKWTWTETSEGNFNYRDADELLNFCKNLNVKTRGHCIFWEVEGAVPTWIRDLNKNQLMTAVQNRLNGLLSRYKGEFKHYDVNNEMLHGSFFKDRLGQDIHVYMFKTAKQLDPSVLLFVNDYHITDGCDANSSPEKYIEQVLYLQAKGASVGGIGVQGHIINPVGPIVCSALDKLGTLGLPIWFTELDVSSVNEHVRAEDLEVMLREAFAHPAVDGIMLWGFWELYAGENAHLVNAEGEVNEAGKRFIQLKEEWLTHADGNVDEQGQLGFRGFEGTYEVEIDTLSKKVVKTFVVDRGDAPVVVPIEI